MHLQQYKDPKFVNVFKFLERDDRQVILIHRLWMSIRRYTGICEPKIGA